MINLQSTPPVERRSMLRVACFFVVFGITHTACAATAVTEAGHGLDPCNSKATWAIDKCPPGSIVACWSAEPQTPWKCWTDAWAPAWSVNAEPFAASALCQSLRTTGGVSDDPHYAGACKVTDDEHEAAQGPLPFLTWEEAYLKARTTLAEMTFQEKATLMEGVGWEPTNGFFDLKKWWYVGNTRPIPRLGIPSLNMQDAADGFRTYWNDLVGSVTTWPSLLCMAATWDPGAVRAFGVALGTEFAGKGANGILGPSINVHRVARNGRNFEYLSGEDPYLGAQLAPQYIQGVQSRGVFTVMKHWVMNEQETNRNTESSNVDPKTAWEIYYPPFQAAVDAGVDVAMCSYNLINQVYSCANPKTIKDLKEGMGFRGFVQSDWWATHNDTTVNAGLDQEMPGIAKKPGPFFGTNSLKAANPLDVNDAVERILAVIYRARLDLTTKCSPPNCTYWFTQNVTSDAHVALSRSLATESIVLLKNEGNILPLSSEKIRSIAIVGSAADASSYNPSGVGQNGGNIWNKGDYYSGGGSGHMVPLAVVTPLEGIRRRAEQEGIRVIEPLGNSTEAMLAAASQADATIVVGGTTCGENEDRAHLHLDDDVDELIEQVSQYTKNVVVLLQVPGTILMPWRDSAAAILTLFLGGQETGNAWANVLFGDHAPTGRLPIMIPAMENDTIPPGMGISVDYSEGMKTSYRNPDFVSVFPFGHGITYTTFEYGVPTNASCGDDICVQVTVTNNGTVSGKTVSQLYLEFPPIAGHPAPLLKGFQKTHQLPPNASTNVTFRLTPRDMSYFDPYPEIWRRVYDLNALIGESSKDIRQSLVLSLPHPKTECTMRDNGTVIMVVVVLSLAGLLLLGIVAKYAFCRSRSSSKREMLSSESDPDSE
mmetsp:Transcript_8904/g.22966  ORF Transcript_8904/g.22966 Transcript_8904/m.22966 type:complete len:880 (+) Transcript_8904:3-2642(+)